MQITYKKNNEIIEVMDLTPHNISSEQIEKLMTYNKETIYGYEIIFNENTILEDVLDFSQMNHKQVKHLIVNLK